MKTYIKIYILLLSMGISACEGFLDAKPEKSLVVPSELNELQALLDNGNTMNVFSGISDIGTDDLELEEGAISGLSNPVVEGNSYLWKPDILEGFGFTEWNGNYTRILYSNVVLEQIERIALTEANQTEWNLVKGSALFYRAASFLDLLMVFGPAYQEATASSELGIPLRLSPEVQFELERSTVEETYSRIIEDLEGAYGLLPERYSDYATRPSKQAVTAMFSMVYLYRGDFQSSERYAKESLSYGGELMDFNTLDPSARFPVSQFNTEVVFHALMNSYSYIRQQTTYIDGELVDSYQEGDLRKNVFFTPAKKEGKFNFRGNYSSGTRGFNGIALDEIYLILSESLIRQGKLEEGMDVLNEFLATRWSANTFQPIQAENEVEALEIVLEERRKTLVMRGRRWADLKRLNLEDRFRKTLERNYGGQKYSLEPGSPRYVYPIPEDEISQNPIVQNSR
ncbi:RagB/SusD family nutrient uptake outer membrane protein [Algoriphagus pacificus]|uniref:RagB/SusD family nutrient uptake outer membrane protein n=1 Tax=Algoriphagus pacificus TaxID=2811234 RepID=A0ABS3CB15_9BACT|nr:RagB/SusD family nutrient uptake outer membrane protein [Algoriphagus pacificus]MBN7814202.1 RagB/SusD family nutrient uptake outer membrane protein [Algoriphagus pacificus]